ncbi:hypothetical protein QTH91_04660 [Variovorax dokdonensis]|uniref:Uncharacterized protein n=1 Tax=Variovorax dokdonensis TaxID=344883 RepID=A0ABT7N743_9BURK|nr:hypothetical protein [Variovorax dokdonensis]MDM0043766.1 hypothetical protein [Variovorax dokdonensis]
MVLDKQEDLALRAALRLLALAQQRVGALFEGYSNLHKKSVAG